MRINTHITRSDDGQTFYDGEELTPKVCDDGRTMWFDTNSKIRFVDLPKEIAQSMATKSSKNAPNKLSEQGAELLEEFGLQDSISAQHLAQIAVKGGSPGVSSIRELYRLSKMNNINNENTVSTVPLYTVCPACGMVRIPYSPEDITKILEAIHAAQVKLIKEAKIDTAN
jgi:hypothetical protein